MKKVQRLIAGTLVVVMGMLVVCFLNVGCGDDDNTQNDVIPPVSTNAAPNNSTPTNTTPIAPTNSVSTNPVPLAISWTECRSPLRANEIVDKMAFLGNRMFLIAGDIYRSDDAGRSWRELSISLGGDNVDNISSVYDIDIDGRNIYLGTHRGLIVSSNYCDSFVWVFRWSWDPVGSVDFQNGYGWGWINSWGSLSGPFRSEPDNPLIDLIAPVNNGSATVYADPFYPRTVCYLSAGYVTIDSGRTWSSVGKAIRLVGKIGSRTVICSSDSYSFDRGQHWQPLGIYNYNYALGPNGKVFSAKYPEGIIVGNLGGPWKSLGLTDVWPEYFVTSTSQNRLWVASSNRLFSASLTEIDQRYDEQ